jgi:heavy metal sensor kinase
MRLSLRARVTLVSAALLALILAATGVFLYVRLQADLLATVDESLSDWATTLERGIERSGELAVDGGPAGADEALAQLLDAEGTQAIEGKPRLLTGREVAGLDGPTFFDRELTVWGDPEPSRILATPAGDGLVLVVAVPVDDQRDALSRLAALLWIGGPLALALTVGVTWLLVGATLRPVDAMRSEADAISASELGRRLPVPDTRDEVARLGETLNEMLGRLERAHERERRFVDDASHELRTPLSNLKAELDLALRRSRTAEELERALRSASEETDRLARLADDLLVLARADRGRLPVRREPVEIARLVAGSVEAFAAAATDRGVEIEVLVSDALTAEVDELRMRQALGNLLENALRHTPSGGRVTIEAGRRDGALRIEVRDTGEGFPSGSLPGVFEAFARPDPSRTRSEGGAGLGLAIVRAVAEAHGGTVEAENASSGGAAVVLTIPA